MDSVLYNIGIVLLIFLLITKIPGIFSNRKTTKEIKNLKKLQYNNKEGIIEEGDIQNLPRVVKKWLRNSNLVGSQWKSSVNIMQRGQIKLEEYDRKFVFASATQVVGLMEPAFVWKVKVEKLPFIYAYGRESYVDGVGFVQMKLLNLRKIADEKGGMEVNQSLFQRYLLELPWYPQAALNKNMKWEQIDDNIAKVSMNHRGIFGEAYFHFDEDGDVLYTSAMRYKDADQSKEMIECINESREINIMDGVRMPIAVDISWRLPNKLYTWFKIKLSKVEYR